MGQNVNSYLDKSEIKFSLSIPKNLAYNSNCKPATLELSKGFKTNYKNKAADGGRTFIDLMDAVSKINPEMRVRFTSPHPKNFPDSLLHLIRDRANICKTMHLPAQSGSSTCLERMRRGYTREAYLELVHKIRDIIPGIAFTSDFIAGFCDETDEEHNDTISLMKQVNYTFCFMYTYSMREKTKAYHNFKDNVPKDVKNKRYLEMLETFRSHATKLNQSKLNEIHLVLVDQISKRSTNDLSGRNDNNTLVIFEKYELPFINNANEFQNGHLKRVMPKVGDYVACRLTSATSQSFRGVPLFTSNLQTFDQIKKSNLLDELDEKVLNRIEN